MTALDVEPDAPDSGPALRAELLHLSEQLGRERARNAGLERGLSALSERVELLRDENVELRRQLAERGAETS